MSYVRTQKCILAQELLTRGEPATSCYLDCGFNDYSSFYRSYLKVFGHPLPPPVPSHEKSPKKGRPLLPNSRADAPVASPPPFTLDFPMLY